MWSEEDLVDWDEEGTPLRLGLGGTFYGPYPSSMRRLLTG